jgi:hypothetical protein
MASLEHFDLELGEALECIEGAAGEIRQLNVKWFNDALRHLGDAVGHLWAVREMTYKTKPNLKQDIVKEYERDKKRWEELNDIFMKACVAQDKGETDKSRKLFKKLHAISRYGYFRLLAEAGLYRSSVQNKKKPLKTPAKRKKK